MKIGLRWQGAFPGLLVSSVLILGCGPRPPQAVRTPTPAPQATATDKEAQLYKKMRGADVRVDSAIQELNDALLNAKKLAPRAGGDAERALLGVVEQLDQAGESLGDYENAPATAQEFKKEFTVQDERRLRSIKTVLDALSAATAASNILNDLDQNVPDGFKKDLGEIVDTVDEAQTDLEQAVTDMGGQIPDDGVTESVDPAQDKTGGSPHKTKHQATQR